MYKVGFKLFVCPEYKSRNSVSSGLVIFILLLCLGFPHLSSGQVKFPFDPATHKIIYKAAVNGGSMSKRALYRASLKWYTAKYMARSVIQMDDSASGRFRSVCSFTDSFRFVDSSVYHIVLPNVYYTILNTTVFYNLDLEIKAGQCTIALSDVRYQYYLPQGSYVNHTNKGILVEDNFENKYNIVATSMKKEPKRRKSWLNFFKASNKSLYGVISSYKEYIRNTIMNRDPGF